ncbi:MAG: BspA family leucine-rich repeat surface protein [Bacteroidales bacterium]|nr:BspA family leucine-rich repeat surface protein [Bacteroidales bacterium]
MNKNYTWKIFSMVACLLLSLFVVSCQKDKDEITEEQARIAFENADKVMNEVSHFFMSAETAEDMSRHIDEIKAIENVEDVWHDSISLTIKIKNGGIINYDFFQNGFNLNNKEYQETGSVMSSDIKGSDFSLCREKSLCIINAVPYDENININPELQQVKALFNGFTIREVSGNEVTPKFLCEEMPKYGVVIMLMHGLYKSWLQKPIDYGHYLVTGVQSNSVSEKDWPENVRIYTRIYNYWINTNVIIEKSKEKRNGSIVEVGYWAINEYFLNEKMNCNFPDNSLMFAITCELLEGNDGFFEKLSDKNLGCFFGYDDTVCAETGATALVSIMNSMLKKGATASEAYRVVPANGRHDNYTGANLVLYPENSDITLVEQQEPTEKACLDRDKFMDFIRYAVGKIAFEYSSSVNAGYRLDSDESEVPIFGNQNGTIFTISTASSEIYSPANCEGLFSYQERITEIDFGNGFNTSYATNMNFMFTDCSDLISLNLSGWQLDNVDSMCFMFDECSSMTSLNLSGWNPRNVEDMSSMFSGCSKLTSLDLSGWNTSSLTRMIDMFEECSRLTSLNLSEWNTSNVTYMINLFEGCSRLTNLNLSGWNTSNVIAMDNMFKGCSRLTSLNLSGWNTLNVVSMSNMFSGCSNLNSLNLSGWNTSNVLFMDKMFFECIGMTSLNIANFVICSSTYKNLMCSGLGFMSESCMITCTEDTRNELEHGTNLDTLTTNIIWNIVGKK